MIKGVLGVVLALLGTLAGQSRAQTGVNAQERDFFEIQIRPILVKRCYACHSAESKVTRGGLALDSRKGWQQGGSNGAVIMPKDAEHSRLLLAVQHAPGVPAMPPNGRLSEREIGALREWIQRGASDPRDGKPLPRSASNAYWAFQPIRRTPPPKVKQAAWVLNPIDAFILAKMESKGLSPSAQADKRTLLRRVTFDLTGLPPTQEELGAFLADRSPNAYEKVVDRLLASPRYGERWGRHWLDVAHYGDTHGYDKDKRRDHAWLYRDYVIRAFNQDKPYSRFIREQIAGDVLSPNGPEGVIATGFVVAGPWDFVGEVELAEGTVEKEKTRLLDRDDMVANTISTFNSVTIHCARCHDHKFDPIPQKDYYRLQAVFAGVERGDRLFAEGDTPTGTGGSPSNGYHSGIETKPDVMKWVQIDLERAISLERIRLFPARPIDFPDTPGFGFPVRFRVEASFDPDFKSGVTLANHTESDFPNPGAIALDITVKGMTARYLRITATRLWKRTGDYVFAIAEAQVFSGGKNVARGAKVTALDSIEQGRWSTRYLVDGADSRNVFGQVSYAVVSRMPRPIAVLARGDVEQAGERVSAGALSCISALPSVFTGGLEGDEGARRLALADWIASPQNPLTWRSIVNRVWHYHFGRGLVDTPNDFGRNGSLPSHPELLDWLAVAFREGGESIKKLHRLIVLSRTYQQVSDNSPVKAKQDSDNRLLWRMNRQRLDAEELRDSVLATSGTLDLTMGGAGYDLFRFKDDHSPIYDHSDVTRVLDPKTWRRTVYRFTVRSVPNPFLEALDAADPNANTPVRNTTLTALQSLSLWNNAFMVRQAELFAVSLQKVSSEPQKQIEGAFLRAFARRPTPQEAQSCLRYSARFGLENLCRLLFNATEFLFVD